MKTNYFFTADFHVFHDNIRIYANRPFKDYSEMNETILSRLNERVGENDYLYILGDIGLRANLVENWLKRVRCKNLFLINGNHDKQIKFNFKWRKDLVSLKINDQWITLCHYAMRTWDKKHFGAWQLYGHSHGTLPQEADLLSMDVGVDTNNFYPYSFEDIKNELSARDI